MAKRRTTHPIHPSNRPLLKRLGREHPAVRALWVHSEARDECIGKEIAWKVPDAPSPIDQEWMSEVDARRWCFSSFAYAFLSFDLILEGWLADDPSITEFEADFLHELPRLRELLDECEQAANAAANAPIRPLIAKAREFLDAFKASILARTGKRPTFDADRVVKSFWGGGKITRQH